MSPLFCTIMHMQNITKTYKINGQHLTSFTVSAAAGRQAFTEVHPWEVGTGSRSTGIVIAFIDIWWIKRELYSVHWKNLQKWWEGYLPPLEGELKITEDDFII